MDTTTNFEANKARLARAILNIDSDELLEKVMQSLTKIFSSSDNQPRNDLTAQMIARFNGAWSDKRSAEEIIEDIYNNRHSSTNPNQNLFVELGNTYLTQIFAFTFYKDATESLSASQKLDGRIAAYQK